MKLPTVKRASTWSELKLRRKMMINVCNLSSNCHLDLPLAVGGGQKIMRTKKCLTNTKKVGSKQSKKN